jgi:sterol O-acyltransferase
MSTSAEIHANGNGHAHHEHILRPRALKPGNPDVLRTIGEDGGLAVNNQSFSDLASGNTR